MTFSSPIVGGHQQPFERVTFSPSRKGHQQNCQEWKFWPRPNHDVKVRRSTGQPTSPPNATYQCLIFARIFGPQKGLTDHRFPEISPSQGLISGCWGGGVRLSFSQAWPVELPTRSRCFWRFYPQQGFLRN